MQTLRVQARSDSERMVHLNIPVEAADAPYEVIVVVQPGSIGSTVTEAAPGWPADFFESTAGAWKGEFVRDQGQFEEREAF